MIIWLIFDYRIVVENGDNSIIDEVISTFMETDDGDPTNSFDQDNIVKEAENQDIHKL